MTPANPSILPRKSLSFREAKRNQPAPSAQPPAADRDSVAETIMAAITKPTRSSRWGDNKNGSGGRGSLAVFLLPPEQETSRSRKTAIRAKPRRAVKEGSLRTSANRNRPQTGPSNQCASVPRLSDNPVVRESPRRVRMAQATRRRFPEPPHLAARVATVTANATAKAFSIEVSGLWEKGMPNVTTRIKRVPKGEG